MTFCQILFFNTKLLHAYIQCVFVVYVKHWNNSAKAVLEVDPMKDTKAILDIAHILSKNGPNSFMHMFNVTTF